MRVYVYTYTYYRQLGAQFVSRARRVIRTNADAGFQSRKIQPKLVLSTPPRLFTTTGQYTFFFLIDTSTFIYIFFSKTFTHFNTGNKKFLGLWRRRRRCTLSNGLYIHVYTHAIPPNPWRLHIVTTGLGYFVRCYTFFFSFRLPFYYVQTFTVSNKWLASKRPDSETSRWQHAFTRRSVLADPGSVADWADTDGSLSEYVKNVTWRWSEEITAVPLCERLSRGRAHLLNVNVIRHANKFNW